jgi:anti-anti-sigma factor
VNEKEGNAMPITSQDYEKVCVLGVQGEFMGDDVPLAKKLVQDAIGQRQVTDFVIDFSTCPFVDSTGLEMLVWAKRRCEELFGRVKLINLDDNVRKILEMTRMESRFECCRDLATALKTMR